MDMVDTVGAGCGMRYAYGMSTGSCTSQMYARVVGCSAYCPTVVATVARCSRNRNCTGHALQYSSTSTHLLDLSTTWTFETCCGGDVVLKSDDDSYQMIPNRTHGTFKS